MSSKRKVTLKLTTQKDLIVFESEARTFGELKKELTNVKWDGMRVVERATKNTLSLDEAILPATDFILFLVPEKVKAGADIDPKTASYNELRSHTSFLNKMKGAKLSMNGSADDLRKQLSKYLNKQAKAAVKEEVASEGSNNDATVETAVEVIEGCRTKINEAIDAIIAAAGSRTSVVEDNTVYVIKTSVDDLESEIESIKKSLKM
jgi:hypothetical protein